MKRVLLVIAALLSLTVLLAACKKSGDTISTPTAESTPATVEATPAPTELPPYEANVLTGELTGKKLALFRDHFGVPYTDADIEGAAEAVKGKTELDALVAYLQSLGHALK